MILEKMNRLGRQKLACKWFSGNLKEPQREIISCKWFSLELEWARGTKMILFRIGMSQKNRQYIVTKSVQVCHYRALVSVSWWGLVERRGGSCVLFGGSSMNDMFCAERGYGNFCSHSTKVINRYIYQKHWWVSGRWTRAKQLNLSSSPLPPSPSPPVSNLPPFLHSSLLPSPFFFFLSQIRFGCVAQASLKLQRLPP